MNLYSLYQNILCFQAHPEFTVPILKYRAEKNQNLSLKEKEQLFNDLKALERDNLDSNNILKFISDFIRHQKLFNRPTLTDLVAGLWLAD